MPYIKLERRVALQDNIFAGTGDTPKTAGELNFLVTDFLKMASPLFEGYIKEKGESYQTYNDIFGALMGASIELVRRTLPSYAVYEDKKINENGDVY